MKGVICVPCVLFGPKQVENNRGKITQLSSFVNEPFCHSARKELIRFYWYQKHQLRQVIDQVDDDHKRQVLENRMRLVPILKTIIFGGHLGIALRGHSDVGVLDIKSAITGVEGNFRALLALPRRKCR
jgi:hypothetical protein